MRAIRVTYAFQNAITGKVNMMSGELGKPCAGGMRGH